MLYIVVYTRTHSTRLYNLKEKCNCHCGNERASVFEPLVGNEFSRKLVRLVKIKQKKFCIAIWQRICLVFQSNWNPSWFSPPNTIVVTLVSSIENKKYTSTPDFCSLSTIDIPLWLKLIKRRRRSFLNSGVKTPEKTSWKHLPCVSLLLLAPRSTMLRETASKSDLGYTHRGKVNTNSNWVLFSACANTGSLAAGAPIPRKRVLRRNFGRGARVTRLKTVIITAGK